MLWSACSLIATLYEDMPATLQSLPEVTAGRSREGEDCAVCLQAFRADETLMAMPCSHAFHQHCISEWLRRNPVCPPPAAARRGRRRVADKQIAS